VTLLEKNCQVRDYPYERESYGDSLARLGSVFCQNGEAEMGCRYIEQGLQTMYALRDGCGIPGVSTDIADAEEALKRYKLEPKNTDRSASLASH
jgi:hypothetical protein